MGLEQRIEELTRAVTTLTEVVLRAAETAPALPAATKDAATPAAAKRTAAPPPAEDVVEVATPEPPAEPAPVTKYEDLMKALTDLGKAMQAQGKEPKEIREAGIACLQRVGAEKLPDVKEKPEVWPALLEAIARVKEGGEP